jgi:hypothetical protein
VIWGQQSFDEMMVCFFNFAFPAELSTTEVLPVPETKAALGRNGQK